MPAKLEKAANAYAAQCGYPTVQAIINRAGAAKAETGKVISFQRPVAQPWWANPER